MAEVRDSSLPALPKEASAPERLTYNLGEPALGLEDLLPRSRLALDQHLLDKRQEEAMTVEQAEEQWERLERLEIGKGDDEGMGI